MIVGTFVPQGWKTELAGIPDPAAKWQATADTAVAAEELGFDSVWVYDHFHNVPEPAHETVFECWTTLAAISQRTSRVRLGQMVGCAGYRNPALVAKIVATLDVISGGRVDWGIGAGWYDQEYRAYGYDFPANADRIRMLRETVEICRLLWTEPDATYEGRHFRVEGAQCDPKPLQDPHPPVWIGGGGEQLTLRVVARHATHANFGGNLEEWRHKRDVLWRHCDEVGRDREEITLTWSPAAFLRASEAEVEAELAGSSRSIWGEPLDTWREGNLVGSPERVLERLAAYRAEGLGGIVVWPADLPGLETIEVLGRAVIPELR